MEEFNRELADILEVDDVRPGDVLADFEAWDSLSVLSVIVMIQRKYDVTLNASDMKETKTAQDLHDLVARKHTQSMPSE